MGAEPLNKMTNKENNINEIEIKKYYDEQEREVVELLLNGVKEAWKSYKKTTSMLIFNDSKKYNFNGYFIPTECYLQTHIADTIGKSERHIAYIEIPISDISKELDMTSDKITRNGRLDIVIEAFGKNYKYLLEKYPNVPVRLNILVEIKTHSGISEDVKRLRELKENTKYNPMCVIVILLSHKTGRKLEMIVESILHEHNLKILGRLGTQKHVFEHEYGRDTEYFYWDALCLEV